MTEFSGSTNIQQALDLSPEVVEAFRRLGLKCVGCPAAEVEDLRTSALYHGKSLEEILRELGRLRIPGSTAAP